MATGLRNAGFDPLAENLPLKLRKDRQEASHHPPGRRGEIQSFVERDKPHAQCVQLVQCIHQIDDGPATGPVYVIGTMMSVGDAPLM